MGFLRNYEEYGFDLRNEVEDHVARFHDGLSALEERILHRQDVVKGRLSALEEEHDVLGKTVDHIKRLSS